MNQQLSTYYAAIQTERENRDLEWSRGWSAGSALGENNKPKSFKALIRFVTSSLIAMGTTAASLVR